MNRRLFFLLLIFLLPCLRFPGALPGPEVVCADDHLSVHHAFQSEAGGSVRHPALSDPALQFKALRRQVLEALRQGHAPLWNPELYGGSPLLADGQSMVASPRTLFYLFLPPEMAQDLGVWWMLVWLGLGTFLLLRRLRINPAGATAGAVGAMTGPYVNVWLLHPHVATFVWLPWLLWSAEGCGRGRNPAWLASAVVGLVSGGHPGTIVHCLLIAGIWSMFRARSWTTWIGLSAGVLLAAPLWLPLADNALHSSSMAVHGGERLLPAQLLDLIWPNYFGHPAGEGYSGPGIWADGVIHPGLMVLALLPFAWRKPLGRGLIVAWVVCVLAALIGVGGPVNHARLAAMGAWFLALAGGLVVGRLKEPSAVWLIMLAIVGSGFWARWEDQASLPREQFDPEPAAWTKGLGALVGDARVTGLGWSLQPNTGSLAGLRDIRGYDLPVSRDWERWARALDERVIRPWFPIRELTAQNQPLLKFAAVRYLLSEQALPGLAEADVGPAPLHVYALEPDAPRAWMASAARAVRSPEEAIHWVAADPRARERPPVEGLMNGSAAERQLPGGLASPAQLTDGLGNPAQLTEGLGNPAQLTEGLASPAQLTDGLGNPAQLTEGLGNPAPYRVLRVTEESNSELWLDVKGPGLVVLADAWAPGWMAEVDGKKRPILRVGGYFRGVQVGEDAKLVCFRYRPRAWTRGWGLFGLGAGLMLLSFLRRNLRPRARSPD